MMKTLKLSGIKVTGNIDNDMKDINRKYGSRFFIEHKIGARKIILPFRIVRCSIRKVNHWILKYVDIDETWHSPLNPLCLYFVDLESKRMNNKSCHLNDIHNVNDYRTKKLISGKEILSLTFDIVKKLKIEAITLGDGATLWPDQSLQSEDQSDSGINLSFLKLLERNSTFYEKYGFKLFVSISNPMSQIRFGTELRTTIARRDELIKQIKIIKTTHMISYYSYLIDACSEILKKGKYDSKSIKIYKGFEKYVVPTSQLQKSIEEIIVDSGKIIQILTKYRQEYIYKVLLHASKKKRWDDYRDIIKLCFDNNIRGMKYKNKLYDNPLWMNYRDIKELQGNYWYIKKLK